MVKMSYKQKHFMQAFKMVTMVSTMAVAVACQGIINRMEEKQNTSEMGLLDKTPKDANDFYGTEIKLYQVNIPLYDEKGKRLPDMWMLTRGLQESSYKGSAASEVVKASINNSEEDCYIRVDGNGAVDTEKGYVGLFVKNGKVVVVADENTEKFVEEVSQMKAEELARIQRRQRIYQQRLQEQELERQRQDSLAQQQRLDSMAAVKDTAVLDSQQVILNLGSAVDTVRAGKDSH